MSARITRSQALKISHTEIIGDESNSVNKRTEAKVSKRSHKEINDDESNSESELAQARDNASKRTKAKVSTKSHEEIINDESNSESESQPTRDNGSKRTKVSKRSHKKINDDESNSESELAQTRDKGSKRTKAKNDDRSNLGSQQSRGCSNRTRNHPKSQDPKSSHNEIQSKSDTGRNNLFSTILSTKESVKAYNKLMENIKKVSSSTRVKEKTRKVNSNRKKTDKIDEESVDDVNKSKDFSKKQKTNHTNDDVNVASKAKSNDDQIKILPDLSFESSEDDDKNDDNDDNVAILLASSGCEENVIKTSNEIKKRNKFSWVKQKVTKDLDEAVDSIVAEGFKLYDDHDLKCGQKFYFRCGKIPKSRKTWCNKRYVVFLPSHNDDVEILWNGHECNHNELLKGQKRPVSEEMTTFIHDFYKEGNTMPSAVLAHIRIAREKFNLFKDEPDPDRRQLEYIHKKYIGKHVKPMINIGDLMEWCEKHSQFPADPNEAFILGYESCSMKEKMSFRFTMTTPNLLKKLAKRETICIDATYKLNWMGFPLIIMGTVDRAKRFHPLIYACSSHERTEDYDFVFRSVKDGIRVHLKKHFNPKTLIADGADAIRNGFYDVFPNAKLDIMCFAHVLRNIRKRPFASKNNKSLIIDDIRKMQLAPNRKVFDYMAMLFCDKWSPLEFNFVQYFKQQWLGSHSNWFEGAAEYTPSTNNALESHNAVIKRKITFRKRLPLNQFLKAMQEMTEDISKQLSNEERIIEEEPTIKKETWTKAARMHMENFKSFKAKDNRDDKETYVVPSSKCEIEDANEKYYKCLVKRQWKSFDEFISFGFQQFWIVQLSIADWKFESKCTCPIFFKHYMCKHVIAIAVKEKVAEFPDLANPVLLAPKRKAGRIAKSKRALEYQQ